MPNTRSAEQVLDEEYLTLRASILELAAGLDRAQRAGGRPGSDNRIALLREAIEILLQSDAHANRAEQVQLLFSRPYDPDWRELLGVPPRESITVAGKGP